MTAGREPQGVDYDGRLFRSLASETCYDAETPTGRYHQRGDLVWAEFDGGAVRLGRLAGHCSPDGTLAAGYVQVLMDGSTVSGEVVSTPVVQADGRIRLRERWRRSDGSTGISWIEEVTDGHRRTGSGTP
jgi:hypothetical protein